jgi:arsenate reductase
MKHAPLRVLFVCTGNAARSQLAEAIFRQLSGGHAQVFSAGSHPESEVHPLARDVLQEMFRIDTAELHPKSVSGFVGQTFDFVITVCDQAVERCPVFPGDPQRIHWRFEDPAVVGDGNEKRRAFEQVANGLAARLRIWMSLPEIRSRLKE